MGKNLLRRDVYLDSHVDKQTQMKFHIDAIQHKLRQARFCESEGNLQHAEVFRQIAKDYLNEAADFELKHKS